MGGFKFKSKQSHLKPGLLNGLENANWHPKRDKNNLLRRTTEEDQ